MTAAFFPAQDEVRQWLQDAAHIAMLTGAGVSAESGVPTFRDAQTGLWANFRAEDLATEAAFRRDPQRVWDWYAERRANMVHVQPNAGHHAVAAFQQRHPGRLTSFAPERPAHKKLPRSWRCVGLRCTTGRTSCSAARYPHP